MYDPKSSKAEEFISDSEIKATLAFADENKNNRAMLEEILAKAREQRTPASEMPRASDEGEGLWKTKRSLPKN